MKRIIKFSVLILLTLFVLCIPKVTVSQSALDRGNYIMQSAVGDYRKTETYSFSSFSSNFSGVDMFRGKININIPIYTIDEQGFQFPISLKYSSSGFKVDELASWVGLGWNLDVPGVITRNIKGLPDESDYVGYLGYGGYQLTNLFFEDGSGLEEYIYQFHFDDADFWQNYSTPPGAYGGARVYGYNLETPFKNLVRISENTFDGSPDLFSYQTGSQNGQFVFDRKGNILQIPKTNLEIVFKNQGADWDNSSFEITDEKGVKYIYDDRDFQQLIPEWSIKSEHFYLAGGFVQTRQVGNHISYNKPTYVSAWHLSKIILPTGLEINFIYETDQLRYNMATSENFFNSANPYSDDDYTSTTDPSVYSRVGRSIPKMHETKKRLVSIQWLGNMIQFNKSVNKRKDMSPERESAYNGYMCDNIVVKNVNNKVVKKVNFYYNYFGFVANTAYPEYSFKKLKLDKIQFEDELGNTLPPYSFIYYEDSSFSPSIYSHHRDVWGFYKYLSNSSRIRISKPKVYVYPTDNLNLINNSIYSLYPRTNFNGEEILTNGYNMMPDLAGVRNYMLKEIQYPTGGKETIEYELNKFKFENKDVVGPGARVKKITKDNSSENQSSSTETTEYIYTDNNLSSGTVAELPTLCRFDQNIYTNSVPPTGVNRDVWSTIVFSKVQNQKDTEVGYRKVTKKTYNIMEPNNVLTSVYYYDFSGSYDRIVDVQLPSTLKDENDDYLYKKSQSFIFIQDNILGYWPAAQAQQYLFGGTTKLRDRHPFLLNPDFDWYRGSLLKEEHLKNGAPVNSIVYNYELGSKIDKTYGINAYNLKLYLIPEGTPLEYWGEGQDLIIIFAEWNLATITIRWGAECYISAFKNLSSKIVTDYNGNGEIVTKTEYAYSENGTYKNKSLLNKVKYYQSNGKVNTSLFKYPTDFSNFDCFGEYIKQKEVIHDNYIAAMLQNCLNDNVCYDFNNGGSENCIACINNEKATYYSNLNQTYLGYEDCIENQGIHQQEPAKAILQLKAKNQQNIIETQKLMMNNSSDESGKLLSGNLTLYKKESSSSVVPTQMLEKRLIEPQSDHNLAYINNGSLVYEDYFPKINFTKYDYYKNLNQFNYEYDDDVVILWGYYYKYPVARIANAKYYDVINALGVSYEDLQTKSTSELKSIFSQLISNSKNPGHALYNSMIQAYTYDPLVGMTSEIDPNGKTTTYNYDDFGRLETVVDGDGNILKKIEYNFFETGNNNRGAYYLSVSPKSFEIGNDGSTYSVSVSSNLQWEVSENSDWLSIIPPTIGNKDGSFQFICTINTSSSPRSSAILISGNGISETIFITQAAGD